MSGGRAVGEYDVSSIDSVFELDILTGTWSVLPRLKQARCGHNSLATDNRVYVYGGFKGNYGSGDQINSFEWLDLKRWRESRPQSATWNTFKIPGFKHFNVLLVLAVESSSIMIVGGDQGGRFDRNSEANDCFIYNYQTKKMTEHYNPFGKAQSYADNTQVFNHRGTIYAIYTKVGLTRCAAYQQVDYLAKVPGGDLGAATIVSLE